MAPVRPESETLEDIDTKLDRNVNFNDDTNNVKGGRNPLDGLVKGTR